jgi:hypothetical protein
MHTIEVAIASIRLMHHPTELLKGWEVEVGSVAAARSSAKIPIPAVKLWRRVRVVPPQ